MKDPRQKFAYRNKFLSVISSGPKRQVTDAAMVRCHYCGHRDHIEITPEVRRRCPPTDIDPVNSLNWQLMMDGWVVALAQVYTGTGFADWDMILCPKCVDDHLEKAAQE